MGGRESEDGVVDVRGCAATMKRERSHVDLGEEGREMGMRELRCWGDGGKGGRRWRAIISKQD